MSVISVRYQFLESVSFEEVEGALVVAVLAVESLYGPAAVRLGAAYATDPVNHTVIVEAATEIGRDLNRVFTGFLSRDLGPETFRVERVALVSSHLLPSDHPVEI